MEFDHQYVAKLKAILEHSNLSKESDEVILQLLLTKIHALPSEHLGIVFEWGLIRNIGEDFTRMTHPLAWRVLYAVMKRAAPTGNEDLYIEIARQLPLAPFRSLAAEVEDLESVLVFLSRHRFIMRLPDDDVVTYMMRVFMADTRTPTLWKHFVAVLENASDAWMARLSEEYVIPPMTIQCLCAIAASTTENTRHGLWLWYYRIISRYTSPAHVVAMGDFHGEKRADFKLGLPRHEVVGFVHNMHRVCMDAVNKPNEAWCKVLFCAQMLNLLYTYYGEFSWGNLTPLPAVSEQKIVAWGREHERDHHDYHTLCMRISVRR